MPDSSAQNRDWTTYTTEFSLSYLRTADTINDKLTAACAADPHLVHLGTSTSAEGWFGGKALVRYRSDLDPLKAEEAMRDVISREVSTVSEYKSFIADAGGEVVAPSLADAKDTVKATAGYGKWVMVTLVVLAIAYMSGGRRTA